MISVLAPHSVKPSTKRSWKWFFLFGCTNSPKHKGVHHSTYFFDSASGISQYLQDLHEYDDKKNPTAFVARMRGGSLEQYHLEPANMVVY